MAVRTPDPDPSDGDDLPEGMPGGLGPLDASDGAANPGWLSEFELAQARRRLPMLYVEAIPVRIDGSGQVIDVGILLRATPLGEITRTIVSGRVRFGETVRDALFRHLENDLGPMAFPLLPASPVPFTVAEYFPIPGVSAFHDDRQHAVSLAFVVPVTGTCEPRQDALEVTWFSPEEAVSDALAAEMEGGRGTLVRQALAHLGLLR
ncbi:ADP-ribose pyrophosphatase YjhB (NUDIX family) [Microbacterium resistens]|uniref:ADP-ribose pyrophosphatase YjhB (NUDIX family) n=1 Tax=Microbacterium resistens TaxID=156977 RepID=A0ABU1SAR4_9MICO|nr:NUDIX hydrolase family protein [Microbacterium resistens]MDR6866670.1 ADP-ribose pyrophosphatase YjhB (NUDIX family) [Microbacterium resistens]